MKAQGFSCISSHAQPYAASVNVLRVAPNVPLSSPRRHAQQSFREPALRSPGAVSRPNSISVAAYGPQLAGAPNRRLRAAAVCAASPSANASTEHYDFVIVGGGPAGLLAAKALLTVSLTASVKVLEGVPGFPPQGAGVLVEINGWRALHAVDDALADRLRARGYLFDATRLFNEQGEPMGAGPLTGGGWKHEESIKAHGHTSVMVQWGDIRSTLFESLPQGVVSFNSRVKNVTPGEPGKQPALLEVTQADVPDGPVRTVSAGMVVAADGYFSRTKRQVWGGAGLPESQEKRIWRAVVTMRDPAEAPELLRQADSGPCLWLGPGMPPVRSATVYPLGHNRFVWTCIAANSYLEKAGEPTTLKLGEDQGIHQASGATGAKAKSRCLAVFGDYPPALVELLRRTDPDTVTEHGYFASDVAALTGAPDWVRGNVVLVGDAAHTAPPDGQGLNMALEDVAVLGDCVRRFGATSQALEAYAAERLPRVRDVWLRPGGAPLPPNRVAAIRAASFTPLGAAPHSGKSRPPLQQQAAAA
ncbi:hypothetical protein HYH02_004739 [Chlamydomonas schloesseri]|uniref:FAD-binding domain-containing protein n=1 Tax=Chlamydomonas schloesseri TaxID=2026947 RepID=A0A836B8I2_9CHLO|nr:hypothetical protein HYH02_004739 [Chlamydomonas schloesseri]|eukprot:KAG2450907.1 hypothetical protein HYH02_004739 [Chlamydomonas schloesseri]